MAKGDGYIRQRAKGVWQVQVNFGRNPVTGEYDRVFKTVHGTKQDARKVRDELRREHENGIVADGSKMTFAELAQSWLDSRLKSDISSGAKATDKQLTGLLCSIVGGVMLSDITPHAVESVMNEVERLHVERYGKQPSSSKMAKTYQHLSQIMQRAVDYDLIMRNPVKRVKPPKQVYTGSRNALSRDDAQRLLKSLNEAENAQYEAFEAKERRRMERGASGDERNQIYGLFNLSCIMVARIALATGMRRGEILGLTWQNVDLDNNVIRVVQSLDKVTGEVKQPKTKSGIRTIAIDPETVSYLARWRNFQIEVLQEFGVTDEKQLETSVCCSNTGSFLLPEKVSHWWVKWRNENGFEELKLHELRHTQATQLLANGVDVKTVQTRLGHASATMTLDMYAHAVPENDRKAAEIVGTLFGSNNLIVIEGGAAREAV